MLLNLIEGKGLCATKEYHTSGEAASPQNALMPAVGVDSTARDLKEPFVLVQASPDVNGIAALQLSLAGCAMAERKKNILITNNKEPFT
jgi:hypothetical protein